MVWLLLGFLVILCIPLVILYVPWVSPKARHSFIMAVRNLWLHKLRSFLSVLGIIIGTCAVITLMAFGEGSMQDALEDIRNQGATNIIIMSVKPPEDGTAQRRSFIARYGLLYADYDRFIDTMPHLKDTLPMRTFAGEFRAVTNGNVLNGRVVATTPRYASVFKLDDKLERGRFLDDDDDAPIPRNVVVLGSEVASILFPAEDPLGKSIRISGKERAFRVVGVLKERIPNTSGPEIETYNTDIYIPLASQRLLLGEVAFFRTSGSRGGERVQLSQIILTVDDSDCKEDQDKLKERVRGTADQVRDLLDINHDRARKDWDIKVPLDKLEQAERTRDRYRLLLAMIAGISLLVGGIGIMNIMLATVTERTREIGIRRALGAKRQDITFQFLVEAVVQTTLGGMVGVAIGLLTIVSVPWIAKFFFSTKLPATLHVPSTFIAFCVSMAVGVLFGWYPARRGAALDPIEALRHE
jgi:putative ABC transport system permease protein